MDKKLPYSGCFYFPRTKKEYLRKYKETKHHGYYNWRPYYFYSTRRYKFRKKHWHTLWNRAFECKSLRSRQWERLYEKFCNTRSKIAKRFCRKYPKKVWE